MPRFVAVLVQCVAGGEKRGLRSPRLTPDGLGRSFFGLLPRLGVSGCRALLHKSPLPLIFGNPGGFRARKQQHAVDDANLKGYFRVLHIGITCP